MKNVLKKQSMRTWVPMLVMIILQLVVVEYSYGQGPSLEDAKDSLEEQLGVVYDILQIIMGAALAVGLVGVVWAYAFNNQTAKDNLTGFVIAALIGAAGSAWLLVN